MLYFNLSSITSPWHQWHLYLASEYFILLLPAKQHKNLLMKMEWKGKFHCSASDPFHLVWLKWYLKTLSLLAKLVEYMKHSLIYVPALSVCMGLCFHIVELDNTSWFSNMTGPFNGFTISATEFQVSPPVPIYQWMHTRYRRVSMQNQYSL